MKNRKYRKRKVQSSSDEDDDTLQTKIVSIKEDQVFRERPNGVSAVSLAVGKHLSKEEELTGNPLKSCNTSKSGDGNGQRYGLQAVSSFSAETKHREEDELMKRYIESELAKRRGVKLKSETEDLYQQKINDLFKIPEYLQTKNKSMTEDMLSDQMLTGIPEVDLGLETKISNIEKTEEAIQAKKVSKATDSHGSDDGDDHLPRNYTHDYARLEKANHTKTTLDILKDDRYV